MTNYGHDNYDQDGWALTQQFLSEENLRGSDEAERYKSFLQNEPGQALSIDTEGAAGSSMTNVSASSSAGQQAALSTSGEHAPKFGAAEPVSSDVSSEDGWQAGAQETQHMLNWFYGMHD
ncbi:hypothetical protein NQ117_22475 [Paenibacillus sp. SC116]|uniref:hypothetical protein n=1 Tax=Paenibacillus sp. SC116 TaxID=2968986 RepID=UPI00215A6396|nr:hypothetical protein [Paenibacillus sp. SC116]MCR8846456.1 hypothetical protein [Paenibacillus sp. SC116]